MIGAWPEGSGHPLVADYSSGAGTAWIAMIEMPQAAAQAAEIGAVDGVAQLALVVDAFPAGKVDGVQDKPAPGP